MKKLIIISLLFLSFIEVRADFWGSVGIGLLKAGEKIGDIVGDAKDFFQNQLPGCAKVVGLGTAYGSAKAALETASFAVKGAEVVGKKTAFDSAKEVLEGVKKTSTGVLTLSRAILKGLGKGFNITCIRFYGSTHELEFELTAKILDKSVSVKEKVDFDDIKSFVEKIFDKLKDEVSNLF